MEGEHRLRVLHVSDLHLRADRDEPGGWRMRRVLGREWEENLDTLADSGPIDLVCFTGDLVQSGKSAEYEALTLFVDALLARVRVPRERLFVVPGNHDIDREVAVEVWKQLRAFGDDEAEALSRWMATGRAPPRIDASLCDAILARQAAYRAWVRDTLGRPELVPVPGSPHPRLGYRATLRLPGQPFDIHVLGLDSAWLAGDEHDARRLRLTDEPVGRLAEGLTGFRLALMHHPLEDLADGDAVRAQLATRVDLLLRGHLHKTRLGLWSEPGRELREVAAGCLYQSDRWPNACTVLDLRLDARGRPVLPYRFWFRAWSAEGEFWGDNDLLYKGSRGGRLAWPDVASVRRSQGHTQVGAVFVGREAELAALAAAVLPASGAPSPVAIGALQGMPGVGKSYLADRFAVVHAASFPGGYHKLALGPDEARTADALGAALASRLGQQAWGGAGAWSELRARLLSPRALLHVENADDRRAAEAVAELVRKLEGCAILVSGRYLGLGESAGWTCVSVATLPLEKAIAMLVAEIKLEKPPPRVDLERLAGALGCLPLALHLAAGYLNARQSVDQFLRRLHEAELALPLRDLTDELHATPERAKLSATFGLSLKLLADELGEKAGGWLPGFLAMGDAPPSGVGRSLGARMAGLEETAFEDLMFHAVELSLAERVPEKERDDAAWRVHPLLAALLRRKSDGRGIGGMTAWFVERLPEGNDQGRRWTEIHREGEALTAWLTRVPGDDMARVERAGSWFAMICGPYPAWLGFCERLLQVQEEPRIRSNALWTLCQVAMRSGDLSKAYTASEEKSGVDLARGAEREAALAAGVRADIKEARGELDEALRIRQEEQLPVYERLGDVRARAVTLGKIADIKQARGELDEALRIRQEEQLPVYERLGDVRERAVTLGKIADIKEARGELDEALRIRQEEQLPVYERLGDVRARAVTLGKIADIKQARGERDEALRIRLEEELPVYERLGDVRERAVTLGKIADMKAARGELDEALRILQEEVLPMVERLGDVRSLLVTRTNIAFTLLLRALPGDRLEAARLLTLALHAAETMRIPEAAQIRAIQQKNGL